ncbi:unnamed protein product [Arctia plantaginis]|uniref:Reverse transcriptase domain-containing protein n=1 Tax=Arctia plantaginis TaxID=874455 RepID=A0A8S1BIK3_ARCPL|nr:unnamed protein product [Arctia plantaginis]
MRRLRSRRQQPSPHGGRPGPSTDSADQDASYGLIVESINPQHSGGDVIESVWDGIYRVIRRCGGARSDEMLRDPARQGSVLTPIASARLLSETFYPQDLEETDTQEQRARRAGVMEGLRRIGAGPLDFIAFTASEVWTVLRGMNPKKAPGEDGFTSDIVSRVMLRNPALILSIYNACLRLGHFPRPWKRVVTRVIPKPGRETYTEPKSYRPIGLLPVLGKVLEKMFATRMLWPLGSGSILSPRQYGFMPQRSTECSVRGGEYG